MRFRSPSSLLSALVLAFATACTGLLGEAAAGPDGVGPGPGDGPRDPGGNPIDPSDPVEPGEPIVCEGEAPGRRSLRLLTRDEYRATVADLLGIAAPDVDSFPVETSVRGYDNESNAQLVTGRHADAYASAAETLVATVDPARFAACDLSSSDCQRQLVEAFGRRAFRRPLASDEVDRYVALFASDLIVGDARVGARLAMEAMLASPSFLYRSEVGEAQADGTFALTSWEIATALSYLFWGTMPDETLFALAESDSLRDPAIIEREARRMLDDPRSEDAVAAFVSRWLGTTRLLGTNRDATLFPAFTGPVRESMLAEERAFVRHVMFERTGRFSELFSADYVMVDANLRTYYGLGAGGSAAFDRVSAPPERVGGLLVMGSVMASHAHSNESSPIRRGLFVRDRLLCQDLPPPPADADTTPPGLDPTLTTRERFRRHTDDPVCSACHQFIDGVGFPFERFDAVGAYREQENGLAIDTSGELIGVEALSDGARLALAGPQELAAQIAESDTARDCMARQWWRWARGTIERDAGDACSVRALATRFEESGGDLRDLMVAVVTQPSFRIRRAAEEVAP
ncbi:DUF1592 domain-containing protein [Sandaracinus amylolyticus]|uniref:Cellulose-binding domain protein n=1 Tax=Sandaracinus amylolyticus TaxID=927083 RepID=A0A0F6W4P4_9BACT|nr:DUF1592 domain-containing protein [Sandaracinus amylolyticus]AKF07252.1 Cellulose-binding domain protein [Sandaracinus amylolyticus]